MPIFNFKKTILISITIVVSIGLVATLILIGRSQFFNPKAENEHIVVKKTDGTALPVNSDQVSISSNTTVQVAIGSPDTPVHDYPSTPNINTPQVNSSPVIDYGNSIYHDSLGVRDPWAFKEGNTTYLYYDCIENLFNPSFESSLGTNGWDTFGDGTIVDIATWGGHSGGRSLKFNANYNGWVGTGKYYYNNDIGNESKLAAPAGIEVMPDTDYIASAYMSSATGVKMHFKILEYSGEPGSPPNALTNYLNTYHDAEVIGIKDQWVRVFKKFRTNANTRAIRIIIQNLESTQDNRVDTFWDSIQLEKTTANTPSDFPTDSTFVERNFNRPIEDTTGWRSCLATSTDGTSFTKQGRVLVTGNKEDWNNVEIPGWMGSSAMYLNVFKVENDPAYYAYYWKGGQPHDKSDQKSFYEKLRIGFPASAGDFHGLNSKFADRSGLAKATSPTGPFVRINSGPAVVPLENNSCNSYPRTIDNLNSGGWGCEYLVTSGVPQFIDGRWVIFTSGKTYQNKLDFFSGGWPFMISSGYATSNSPLGPWVPSAGQIVDPNDLTNTGPIEGPIYYYDRGSGRHVLFYNQLGGGQGGGASASVLWQENGIFLQKWSSQRHSTVLRASGAGVDAMPWSSNDGYVNLQSLVEDGNGLNMYYGIREKQPDPAEFSEGMRSFLFHAIGKARFNLPLFSPPPFRLTNFKIAEGSQDALLSATSYDYQPALNYTLSNTTPGLKLVFVEFIYTSGTETRSIIEQKPFIYQPEGSWSEWGACSATCGGGTRSRTCNGIDGAICSGGIAVGQSQTEACNTQACPVESPQLSPTPVASIIPDPTLLPTAIPTPVSTAIPSAEPTPVSEPVFTITSYKIAEGSLGGLSVAQVNPYVSVINYTLSDTSPGVKIIFVEFIYSSGTETRSVIEQKQFIYRPDVIEASPVQSPIESPVSSPEQSPLSSPLESPLQSPLESPIASPEQSPVQSPVVSPIESPLQSPVASPEQSPISTPRARRGDANGDGNVNALDFVLVVEHYEEEGENLIGDLNFDGFVNALDFGLVVENYDR